MTEVRTTSSTGGQKGTKLARFDLIPAGPLRELAEHYGRGARKYADNQWRNGYEWSKSIAALGRHFNDFMAGKDYDVCENDPDGCSFVDADGQPFEGEETEHGHTCFNHTGSHHMAAVAWHAFLLLEFKDTHQQHDDRHKAPEPESWLDPELWVAAYDFDHRRDLLDSIDRMTANMLVQMQPIPDAFQVADREAAIAWGNPEPLTIAGLEEALEEMRKQGFVCWYRPRPPFDLPPEFVVHIDGDIDIPPETIGQQIGRRLRERETDVGPRIIDLLNDAYNPTD